MFSVFFAFFYLILHEELAKKSKKYVYFLPKLFYYRDLGYKGIHNLKPIRG